MNGLKDHREFTRETERSVLSYWDCMSCNRSMPALDVHGRCVHCQSSQVCASMAVTLTEKCIQCGQTLETGHLVNATLDAHLDCSNPCGIAHTRFEVACA